MNLTEYLENKELFKQAEDFATKKYTGQKRRSGEDYIEHPRRVAKILSEVGAPKATIAAAYAHDTIEDTPTTIEEIKQEFGTAATTRFLYFFGTHRTLCCLLDLA